MLSVPRGSSAIVIATSGGPDSAVALDVVRRARPQARLFACYVDHRLRPAAAVAGDIRAVRAQARVARAEMSVLRLPQREASKESVEAAMRSGRYALLYRFATSVGAACVVTGHQRDDLAESALLALVRGAGIDGLAAMRPRRVLGAGVHLVRPLLWAPKRALTRYAAAAGFVLSTDATNADTRYRRNAVRRLLEGLEEAARGSSRAIARSAAIAIEDKALLDAMTASFWSRSLADEDGSLKAAALRALPTPLLRRVIRYAVKRVVGHARDFSYDHCVAIAGAVKAGRGGTYHAGFVQVVLSGSRLTVRPKSANNSHSTKVIKFAAPPKSVRAAWANGVVEVRVRSAGGAQRPAASARTRKSTRDIYLDATILPPGTALELRAPSAGDRFTPSGRRSAISLARFLAKAGLSREERSVVPLLCTNGAIAAVVGVRAAAGFAARKGAKMLEVRWTKQKTSGRGRLADE